MTRPDFQEGYRGLRGEAPAALRRERPTDARSVLRGPPPRASPTRSAPSATATSARPARTRPHPGGADARDRRAASPQAGLLGAAVPPPHGTHGPALAGGGARGPRLLLLARRHRLRHAGPRLATPSGLAGTDVQKEPLAARGARRARCCAPSRSPSRRPAPTSAAVRTRAARDGALWRLHRRQDLHLERRHRRPLHRAGPHRRGARARRASPCSWWTREAPGLTVKPLEPMAPHPLGEVRFDGVPARAARRGGKGLQAGPARPSTRFRPSVGAAACGLAPRALDEALRLVAGPPAVRPRPVRVPGHPDGPGRDARRARGRRGCSCGTRPG